MIVSHRHRFIFMKTRKTGGTSIEIALSRVCGPDDIITPLPEADEVIRAERGGRPAQNHTSPPLPTKLVEHVFAGKAAEVLGPEVWGSYFKFAVDRNPWDAVVSLYFWVTRHQEERESFETFLADRPNVQQIAHRNYRITHIRKQPAVDRILRFERLSDEFADVWRELGLPGEPELPRAKAGVRPKEASYRSFYTDESRELVARLFERTIAERGYEF